MNERLRSLGMAVLALLALVAIMFGAPLADDGYDPVTSERNVSGLAALTQWLSRDGVTVQALDTRFFELPLGKGGDVLLVHLPLEVEPTFDERGDLLAWVADGNVLIVASFANEEIPPSRVSTMTELNAFAPGLMLEDRAEEAASGGDDATAETDLAADIGELLRPLRPPPWVLDMGAWEQRELAPVGEHVLTANIRRIEVVGDLHGHVWRQAWGTGVPWLPLLADARSGSEVAWIRRYENGRILTLLHPSMFANGGLGRADNALLARNLVRTYLADGGVFWVDDAHQGLGIAAETGGLLSDIRTLWTLFALIACWLVWVLADVGSYERVTRARALPRRRRADLVRAMGAFLSRNLYPHHAADYLLAPLRELLAQRHGVAADAALARLVDEPAITEQERTGLNRMLVRAQAGRRISLIRLHTLVLQMQEKLR